MPLSRLDEKITEKVIEHVMTDLDLDEESYTTEDNGDSVVITITDTETPAGSPAIEFTLPISQKMVVMMKPTTAMMLNIEQEINKKHRNCGDFERSLVMLARIICKVGDREGEKCINFSQLMGFDVEDVIAMNQASQVFFRSVVTRTK